MDTQEIWKDIPGYEEMYQCSNLGRVKSFKRGGIKILSPGKSSIVGHLSVILCKDNKKKCVSVHRIVASCFLGLDLFSFTNHKTSLCVCHKDDNPKNNRVDNLFLGTRLDNNHDTMNKGKGILGKKGKQGKDHHLSKSVNQISFGKVINNFSSTGEAFRLTGIHQGSISHCARGGVKSAGGFQWEYENK